MAGFLAAFLAATRQKPAVPSAGHNPKCLQTDIANWCLRLGTREPQGPAWPSDSPPGQGVHCSSSGEAPGGASAVGGGHMGNPACLARPLPLFMGRVGAPREQHTWSLPRGPRASLSSHRSPGVGLQVALMKRMESFE